MRRFFAAFLAVIFISVFLCSCTGQTNDSATEYVNENGHRFKLSSVRTPKNSVVQTCIYSPLTAEEKDKTNKDMQKLINAMGWSAKKLREPTLSYNCHSYAWYSQSTNNTHWINRYWIDPKTETTTSKLNLDKYWTDKSYTLIATVKNGSIPSYVPNNSKVFYVSGDHSAIKVSSTKVMSKWGWAGLYEHLPMDCPYISPNLLSFYK